MSYELMVYKNLELALAYHGEPNASHKQRIHFDMVVMAGPVPLRASFSYSFDISYLTNFLFSNLCGNKGICHHCPSSTTTSSRSSILEGGDIRPDRAAKSRSLSGVRIFRRDEFAQYALFG